MCNLIKTTLLMFVASNVLAISVVLAETPPELSLNELCKKTDLILSAVLVKKGTDSFYDLPFKYNTYEFEISEVYYGKYKKPKIRVAMPVRHTLNPGNPTYGIDAFSIPGKYDLPEKYFLFLKRQGKKGYYMRLDEIWGIKKYSSSMAEKIKKEIAIIKTSNNLKSKKNKAYGIPIESIAKPVKVDGFDLISKKNEYYLDEKLIGIRGWYENNQISFEEPIKDGKLDGVCRYWNMDGSPQSIENYKNDKLDGMCLYWSKDDPLLSMWIIDDSLLSIKYYKNGNLHGPSLKLGRNLGIFYWIDGWMEKERKYMRSMRKNKSLPKVNIY